MEFVVAASLFSLLMWIAVPRRALRPAPLAARRRGAGRRD
jgi:hypothetical protein